MIKNSISTEVAFTTDNPFLGRLYRTAEEKIKCNITCFGERRVLVEGAEYPNIWLETQPMGGEMYGKRDMEAALNNQLLFMEFQRGDGRLPGMISYGDGKWKADYAWMQGFCFPAAALNMYYLNGENREYLEQLYRTLEGFDGYLWRYRDSDGDGCLETWCVWDTGEDNSTRLADAPNFWDGETPPKGMGKVPYESMDYMAYSFDCRNTLAEISVLLKNGRENYWKEQAGQVQDKIKSYLWREEKHACYDRDADNQFMDVLIHNNLRVMYHNAFDQKMADAFICCHLLNPDEFWTPMPLPSIAVNEPLFRNFERNDWSGQPEGLTFQRAIRALENYGHLAEMTLIGQKLLAAVGKSCIFTQQFDPFTGQPSRADTQDGYGPTILAALEYLSRFYGIHKERREICWGTLQDGEHACIYTQRYGDALYRIDNRQGQCTAYINDREIFRVSCGVRVVTDEEGTVLRIAGMDTQPHNICLQANGLKVDLVIQPNEVFAYQNGRLQRTQAVPFDYPYKG